MNSASKGALLSLFLVVFIDLLGFGIVIPILPYYAQSLGADAWQLGWLMTSYSLMQLLVAPLWGSLSDRIGRRPVLLVSILGTMGSLLLLSQAHSLLWLFLGRLLAGAFGANISTAYAYIADVTTEENRAKGMGIIGAGFGMGFIFGPAIGGVLSAHSYSTPMLFAAGLAAVNFVLALWLLREPPLSAAERAARRTKRWQLSALRSLSTGDGRRSFSAHAIGLFFLSTFALTQMEVVFALYMNSTYHYDARASGMLLAMIGVIMALVQGGAIGRLARRFGEVRLILAGSLLCAIGLGALSLSQAIGFSIGSLCVMALGHGILHPSLSSLTSLDAPPAQRGAILGLFQSAGSLARVVGPPCAGWLYDHSSPRSPFMAAALVLLVVSGASAGLIHLRPRLANSAKLV